MHRLTLYQLRPDGKVDSMALSADQDFAMRPVKSNNLVFPVHLPQAQQNTFYLKATGRALIRASMSFNTMQPLSLLTSIIFILWPGNMKNNLKLKTKRQKTDK